MPAAAPRMKAPTLQYKSHQSYNSSSPFKGGVRRTGDLAPTDQAAAVMVFAEGSFYPASPMLCGNAAEQGGCPRSCGRPLCSSATPPSPARRPATTSQSPCARVVFQPQLLRQFVITNNEITIARKTRQKKNDTCPVRLYGNLKPLLLRKSYERPSRLSHILKL